MKCSSCNKEIPDNSEFCSYCGSKQEERLFCYKCGHEIPNDSEFCQFCGSTQPARVTADRNSSKDKKHVKKSLIIGIVILVVLIIAAFIIFVVIKPFEKKNSPNSVVEEETTTAKDEDLFDSMSVEEKIAQSKSISLGVFRTNFESLTKQNVHLSGYVIDAEDWGDNNTIVIAETIQWPYETTDMYEYYGKSQEGGTPYDEWKQLDAEWQTVKKTPAIICKLKDDGIAEGTPKEGDIVDVYCIVTQGQVKAFPYYVKVN